MERDTVEIYEADAVRYAVERGTPPTATAEAFRAAVDASGVDGPRLDLGCGPGGHLLALGRPVVGGDAAPAMLAQAAARVPGVPLVGHDLEHLPFGRASLGAVWASKCLQHIPQRRLPLAMEGLHHAMAPDALLHATVFGVEPGSDADTFIAGDAFPGREFWQWDRDRLALVVRRAGFEDVTVTDGPHHDQLLVTARRGERLPDFTAGDLRVLVVGLNPSWHAVRAGYGYAGPGNRFWPAALASGLVSVAHDPRHAVLHHGVGFTDLVKRPTARASEVSPAEFRAGADELSTLVDWLAPAAVCVVGLTGWRAARNRKATVGWQPAPFGGRPVYVMPNPSGLNAATPLAAFVEHFRSVQAGP